MRILKPSLLVAFFALSSFQLLGQVLNVTVTSKNACAGSSNGSITITVDNTTTTTAPYSYFLFGLTNGSGPFVGSLTKGVPSTISNLPIDSYIVNVSDNSPSVANFTTFVNVTDVSPGISLSSAAIVTNNSDCSSPNGAITISPTGGSGSYTYSWTGPGAFTANTQNLTGLSGGSYVVTIGDTNANCTFTSSAIVVADPLPNAFTIATPDNTLCTGDNLVINLNAPAPESGVIYTVELDGALTGTTFAGASLSYPGLSVGSHTIRVKAALGSCTPIFNTTPNISVTVYGAVTFSTVKTDVTCNGNTDGTITVTASGGSGAGYTYSKDNGTTYQASNVFSALAAATYQIVVKDGNGCLSTATAVIINQPTAVTFTDVKTDVTGCFGNANGKIVVTASGGSGAGYRYSKNNGTTFQVSNTFNGLVANTYQIVVKDGSGCLSPATAVTINQPTAVTFSNVKTDVACNGGTTGSIVVTASGGAGTYTYSKDNGVTFQASNTFSSLAAATYQIVVKDGNGCLTAATAVTINQPAAVTFSNVKTDVTCNGGADGSIVVTASGGSGVGYTYSKDNGTTFQVSNTFSSLTAATYQVVVKDGSGCLSAATAVTIAQPVLVTFTDVKTDVTGCFGNTNGSIVVTASGGSGAGYSYSKDNGVTFQASNTFSSLGAATYQVVVKDGNGCLSAATSVIINQPVTVTFSNVKTDVTCNGSADGSIVVTASGGNGAYTYSKDNGTTFQAGNTFSSLVAATYQVIVKDGNGCLSAATSITINQPLAVTFTDVKTDVTCNGGNNGSIVVTASGGNGTYTYSSNNGGSFQASNTFSSLAAATYQVVVKDGNGCVSAATSVTVIQPAAVTFADVKTDVTCNGGNNGSIIVTASGGSGAGYTYSNDNGTTFQASNTFSSLSVATYQVVVKDGNGCLSAATSVTISQPAAVTFTDVKTDVTCNGGTNGSIVVTASGGSGAGYTYSNDNGTTFQASSTFSSLAAATYQIVVKDGNGCLSAMTAVTINQPTPVTFTDVATDVTCNGGNNGKIVVTASGGSGAGYTYSKNNGVTFQASKNFNGLVAGTYQIVVKDGNGCLSTATAVTINQPVAVTFTEVATDVTCNAGTNGSIVVTAAGGNGTYTYSKDNGTTFQASNIFSSLAAATYQVKVKDGNGCLSIATSVTINQPTAVTSANLKTDVTCNGGNNGSIVVTASGGSGAGYTYSDDNGTTFQASNTFSSLVAGTYQVVVKDGNACLSSATAITLGQPVAVTFTDVKTDATCSGATDGTIVVTASGGSGAGYTYSDDNGTTFQASNTFSSLPAATYQIVVKDGNGCLSAATSVTINQPAAVTFTNVAADVTCNGGSDGTITVTASGGSGGGYTYSSNNGGSFQAGNIFSGLTAATYQVVVKDGNGCLSTATAVTINQPSAVTFTNSKTDVTCNGGTDGTITVTASGGSGASYTYSSNNGGSFQASNVFSALAAATYQIVVKDGNGCVSTPTSVTINQPLAVTFTDVATDVTGCFGNTNGSIVVAASGGSGAGYTYSNDNGTTFLASNTFSSLPAATYQIVVKDGNGCLSVATAVTINQPSAVTFTNMKTDVSCNGGTDGSITVTASGGNGTYTYSSDNGATFLASNVFASLPAGTYQIVVKDGNACLSVVSSVTITEPTAITFTTNKTDVTCNGGTDGTIVISASGGSGAGYSYSKDGGASFLGSNTFSSLAPSAYQIVVKDGSGCVSPATAVTIGQPVAVTFTTSKSDVSCNGGGDGSITVTASGGNGSYTYSDDNGTTFQASNTFSVLPIGTYQIVVKDGNGCLATAASVTINQPATVSFSTTFTDASCNGGNDGSIVVTASGGTGTYTYSKDNGTTFQASNTFGSLTAGNYQVVVKDVNGCLSAPSTVTIGQPTAITFTTSKVDVSSCIPGNDGSITVSTASGGSGAGYTYSNDNGATFQAGNSFASLTAGNYLIVVKDGNGCVSSPAAVTVNSPGGLSFSTTQLNVLCNGGNNGSITMTTVGGNGTYTYSKDNGATFVGSGTPFTFSSLTAGTYQLVVKDGNGCQFSGSVTVTEPAVLSFTTSKTDVSCNGASDGTITVTPSGGTSAYQYSKDGGATFQAGSLFSGLPIGSYSIVVKDANNCITTATSISINQPTVLSFSTVKTDATTCSSNDGTITVTASGGTGVYQYSSDNGATFQASNIFSSLAAATYNVVVKDANNCVTAASSVSIGSPSGLTFTTAKTDATCNGVSNGTITVTVSGGTAPYQYSSDNGVTFQGSNILGSLAAATYTVVAKDVNGCQFSSSVIINQPSAVTFTFVKVDASCAASDGSITVTASGGNNIYSYSNDNGVSFQGSNVFSSLGAQTYQLVVKDGNACSSVSSSVTISSGSATPIFTKTDATCAANDGSIVVNSVSGGTAPYQYSIDNGTTLQASNTFSGLSVASYALVTKDVNGCISAAVSVAIGKPAVCGGTNCGAFTILATDTRPTCAGQDDGTITINVTGGSPNYIVTLSDPSQGFNQALVGLGPFTFINLSQSLNYQYTVKDQAGNTCTLPYSLPIQTNVQATASGFVDAKCFNQAVGQATITVTSGGTAPYEYSLDAGTTWVSFTSPVIISNLMPAPIPYSILVRDGAADLCPAQVSVTINNAVTDLLVDQTATDATCANNDGKIQINSVSGGTGPYTYQFDGNSTANNLFTGLAGGVHNFIVTDANGCSKNFPITVNFPGLVNFTSAVTDPTCSGAGNDGAIVITITSSGTFQAGITTDPANPPASLQNVISAGNSTVSFGGLSKNTYYVWVQAVGALCPTKSAVAVSAGPDAVDFSFITKDIKCFEDNGGVRVFAFKGSAAVSYSYEVIQNGNIAQSGAITQLQALDTVDILGFTTGDYQIRLFQDQSSATGCVNKISSDYKLFSLSGPTASLDTLYVNKKISYPDAATGSMLIGVKESQEEPYQVRLELTAPLYPTQSKLIDWTTAVRNTQNLKVEFDATNLYAGGYKLSIRDGLGCIKTYDINLDVDTNIFVPNIFTPNGDASNETFYIRNLPTGSQLKVSNRWGAEVFSSSDYDGKWDGGTQTDGVYFYRLVAGGQVYTGWVEILRGTGK
jgi:hypothetical protein